MTNLVFIIPVAFVLLFLYTIFGEALRSKLCPILGHKIPKGWGGGLPYFRTQFKAHDGLNVEHWYVTYKCACCDKEQYLGLFHLPKPKV